MEISNMKNMLVLKNLPSNLIDEAIVVLKSNKNAKRLEHVETNLKFNYKKSTNSGDYLVKEAESVISNYISDIEKNKESKNSNINIEKKYKRLKIYSICVTIALILSICL